MRAGGTLTRDQAIEIYRRKPCNDSSDEKFAARQLGDSRSSSVPLAFMYGVSPKAVRDIWKRRTWAFETYQLWQEEQADELCVESFGPSTIRVRTHYAILIFYQSQL